MHILFLTSIYEDYGGYYRCFNLGRYLCQNGIRVTMICASKRDFDLRIRKRRLARDFELITLPRVKYHKYFTGQLLRMCISCIQTLCLKYDIMHAFTVAQPQVGIPAWIAKRIRRKTVIVDWEDLWGGGFADYHPFPVKQVLSFFERSIPFVADSVTVVSRLLWDTAAELGLDTGKMHKIPNGSSIDRIGPLDRTSARRMVNLQLDAKILLAMGNTYLDSLGLLLDTFRLVSKQVPDALLVMVGKVDIPGRFQDLYREISDRTLLVGARPFKEISLYLGAADVLILPMDDVPIEKARFPMRFGDYIAAGRPIASNAVGEVKYYLEKHECGLTAEPDDVPGLAASIIRLFGDREYAESLGKRARTLAENDLAWSNIVADLRRVYEEAAR